MENVFSLSHTIVFPYLSKKVKPNFLRKYSFFFTNNIFSLSFNKFFSLLNVVSLSKAPFLACGFHF
jgi:hypothetical protein